MSRLSRMSAAVAAVLTVLVISAAAQTASSQQRSPLYQQFLSNPNPLELVAARKTDRIAWTAYEEGKRNAYTAVGPSFTPVRLTNFMKDDGIMMSDDPHL